MTDDTEIARILGEIRDAQKAQLAKQEEALQIQREQFAMWQRQTERTERIQDRAEKLQSRSDQMIGVARKTLFAVLPILIVLIAYVTFLIFG